MVNFVYNSHKIILKIWSSEIVHVEHIKAYLPGYGSPGIRVILTGSREGHRPRFFENGVNKNYNIGLQSFIVVLPNIANRAAPLFFKD